MRRPARRWRWLGSALLLVPAAAIAKPELLPWPYQARIGRFDVYAAEAPTPALAADLTRAEALLRRSPIDDPAEREALVMTGGGWRWRVLAVGSAGAFALRRPAGGALVVGRADAAADRIFAGDRTRRLSAVVAHETTHALVAHRLGMLKAAALPRWVQEGLADHVAQESTLTPAEAERLRRTDPGDPALFYFDARRRVEAALARGVTVDQLLSGAVAG